jgi:hypothetical protein
MNTKAHYFVRGLFRGMEKTPELAEQRQELETHILEHIADLSAGGMDAEEAFARAVDSLGNLDKLIETLSGRKVKIPVWRHDLAVYGLALLGLIRFSPQAASLSLVTALLILPLALIVPLRRIMGQDIVALLDG